MLLEVITDSAFEMNLVSTKIHDDSSLSAYVTSYLAQNHHAQLLCLN